MLLAFVGKNGRGTRRNIVACKAASTSSPERSARRWVALPAAIPQHPAAVVDWLRQRSRPYLFSNTLAPVIAAASLKVFDMVEHQRRACASSFMDNACRFRDGYGAGWDLISCTGRTSDHSGHAWRCQTGPGDMAARMLELGVYVIGFSFPVVPEGKRRPHSHADVGGPFRPDDIDRADRGLCHRRARTGCD